MIDDFHWRLDETEPCAQEFDKDGEYNDPDKWVGNWVNSTTPEVAKELCAECHVINECLIYALTHNEKDFIWGGATPDMRKEMRDAARRQRIKKTDAGHIEDTIGENKTA